MYVVEPKTRGFAASGREIFTAPGNAILHDFIKRGI